MISKISQSITSTLIKKQQIDEADRALYDYGFFMMLSQILYGLIALFAGIISGRIAESIVFYLAFVLIRNYAGGYHAPKESICFIVTTSSLVGCVVATRFVSINQVPLALFVAVAVAVAIIAFFAPLDTEEKPLTDNEFHHFRKISWLILAVIVLAVVVSYIFKVGVIFAPCCMSLILESILLLIGKVNKIVLKNKVIN